MTDRRNRLILTLIALLLAAGGGLALSQASGVFGPRRSSEHILDPAVTRLWDQGGWVSYAVVDAAGVVLVALGTPSSDNRDRPDPVQITLRFKAADPATPNQLIPTEFFKIWPPSRAVPVKEHFGRGSKFGHPASLPRIIPNVTN